MTPRMMWGMGRSGALGEPFALDGQASIAAANRHHARDPQRALTPIFTQRIHPQSEVNTCWQRRIRSPHQTR